MDEDTPLKLAMSVIENMNVGKNLSSNALYALKNTNRNSKPLVIVKRKNLSGTTAMYKKPLFAVLDAAKYLNSKDIYNDIYLKIVGLFLDEVSNQGKRNRNSE